MGGKGECKLGGGRPSDRVYVRGVKGGKQNGEGASSDTKSGRIY